MNFFMILLVSFVMSFMKWFVDGRKLQKQRNENSQKKKHY